MAAPIPWMAETFSTSPLKPLKGIWRNLTGSKDTTPSTKFVFVWPIGKPRWLPLISRYILYFSFETAQRNLTKVGRKQEHNVLYYVCVFRADRITKMAAKPMSTWAIFDFSSETAEKKIDETWKKQEHNVLHQVSVFRAIQDGHPGQSVNKDGTLYSGARYVALWPPCSNFALLSTKVFKNDANSTTCSSYHDSRIYFHFIVSLRH